MRRPPPPETIDAPAPRRRGRPFAEGNSGRKPGSQNRTTRVAAALLEDEAAELVRTAIDLGKAGDVMMLKFLVGRILPKERSVRVELPPTDGDFDAVDAMAAILNAAVSGQILPSEAAALASVVTAYARALDVTELRAIVEDHEKRFEPLEKA
jgi:hypothetical protein